MIIKCLKAKLLGLAIGALLLQAAGQCVPVDSTAFSELTKTGGTLVGVLFVPQGLAGSVVSTRSLFYRAGT